MESIQRKRLKDEAKALLRSNLLHAMILGLIMAVVAYFSQMDSDSATELYTRGRYDGTGFIIMFISLRAIALFVSTVIYTYSYRFYMDNKLKSRINREASLQESFVNLRDNGGFLRIILNSFIRELLILLSIVLTCLLMILILMLTAGPAHPGANSIFSDIVAGGLLLGLVVGTLPSLYLSYRWYFLPAVMADDPTLSFKDAAQISATLTDKRKFNLWVFDLSFLPWMLLAIPTFGISNIYTLAYQYQTASLLYLETVEEKSQMY